jgi:hypothetical protein
VIDKVLPVIEAGGFEPLIDVRYFKAGQSVVGQMDSIQDSAECQCLFLCNNYLNSDYCKHEMTRAIATDPKFKGDKIIPVLLEDVTLPRAISKPNPLYVKLYGDESQLREGWKLLCRTLSIDFGVSVVDWLKAKEDVKMYLSRNQCVNLVVRDKNTKWKTLINHLAKDKNIDLKILDFESGRATFRPSAVQMIVEAAGYTISEPKNARALVVLDTELCKLPQGSPSRQAWLHFYDAMQRTKIYDRDFFSAIRNLVQDKKRLVLLIHSRQPVAEWIEQTHDLSKIDFKTVWL